MNELTYSEKLEMLKRKHARSHPEARQQIAKWGDELSRIEVKSAWLKHPDTGQIRKTLVDQLERIASVLADDKNLPDMERKVLFEVKDVILQLLAVVTGNTAEEIRAIEQQMDDEL